MVHRTPVLLGFAFMALLALGAQAVNACDKHACAGEHDGACASSDKADTVKDSQQTAPAAGMRVNIDPKTGAYIDRPVGEPNAKANVTTDAAAAPVETPLPGGGSKLDTRGVRQEMTATANPGGTPVTHCEQTGAPAAPQN